MKKNRIIKLSLAAILSLQIGVFADNNTNTIDSIDVISSTESAYGSTNGLVATKSATGSKMDVDITEIPQSLSVVTKDAISNMNAQNITNVTAYTSSITNSLSENGDARTNYGNIRGIGLLYKSSFLDGLKLLYGGFLIPKIDPYGLEKVEVLKGPSSVLYGASGPGGLLNLQSKKPSIESSNEIGVTSASFDNKTIFADLNNKINDKLLFRVTGKYKEGDNDLNRSTNKSYFINPSLTYLLDEDSDINLQLSVAHNEILGLGMSYGGAKNILNVTTNLANFYSSSFPTLIPQLAELNAANLSTRKNIGLPDQELIEKDEKSITLTYNKKINEDLKFRSIMRYTKMEGDINTSQLNGAALASLISDLSVLPFSYAERSSDIETFAIDNNIEYKWGTKNIENTSLFGLDYQYTNWNTKKTDFASYSYDLLNTDYSQYVNPASTYQTNEVSISKQLGVYAQNHMKIYDKFVISSSLRYDKLKETVDDKTSDNDDVSQNNNNISGRLGLIYLFDNGISPYVTYSTSFQGNVGSDSSGKKFLPSIGNQIEIGTKFKPKDLNALFTIAAFKIEQEDNISQDPNSTSSADKVQEGDAEVTGIEFDVTINPIENMNLSLSYAKMDGKEVNTANSEYEGRDLSGLPDFSTSLWADYTFNKTVVGNLKLGTGIKYVGKSKLLGIDYLNSNAPIYYDVDSYTTVDALVSTTYKNATISFNVYNVFNEESEVNINQISSAETQGRTYSLTLKYKF
jgi:iron complex outermembrane receptor protein